MKNAPYFEPYGNPCERASIPKEFEREFSRGCLERSLRLWDGSNLLIRDLPEEIIGTNKNDEVVKVLRKEIERI